MPHPQGIDGHLRRSGIRHSVRPGGQDVLTLARGLAEAEARSPFTDGLYGMEEKRVNAAIRKMKDAGLISSRRDGNDHVYFLNESRFREIIRFLESLVG